MGSFLSKNKADSKSFQDQNDRNIHENANNSTYEDAVKDAEKRSDEDTVELIVDNEDACQDRSIVVEQDKKKIKEDDLHTDEDTQKMEAEEVTVALIVDNEDACPQIEYPNTLKKYEKDGEDQLENEKAIVPEQDRKRIEQAETQKMEVEDELFMQEDTHNIVPHDEFDEIFQLRDISTTEDGTPSMFSPSTVEVSTMVEEALMHIKSRGGCTLNDVCTYVQVNYPIHDIKKSKPHFKRYLVKEVKAGNLVLVAQGSTIKYMKAAKKV